MNDKHPYDYKSVGFKTSDGSIAHATFSGKPSAKQLAAVKQLAERFQKQDREKEKKVCHPCGKPFLLLEDKSAAMNFPQEAGICCICLKEKLVSDAANYNYPPKKRNR